MLIWLRGSTAAVIGVLLLAGAGCALGPDPGRAQVVVGMYPLEFLARQIVGNAAEVTDLTAPGVEPHDLELTVRQTALISGADLVVYEKGLAPALDKAVANNNAHRALDTTQVVPLSPPTAAEEEADGENMDAGDPHFWQDPTLLAKVADALTAKMIAIEPAHAETFRANDHKLQRDLARLDAAYRKGLAHCRTRTLVVSHDAFEYLGRRYDLRIEPIAGLSPDAEPSVQHLAQLSGLVRTDHITTVFSEQLASPKLAESLAANAGVRTAVLDPLEGLSSKDPNVNYLTLMRANLRNIQQANRCR